MKFTLIINKETEKEKMSEIVKNIIIPFIKTLPDESQNEAGIYAKTPFDLRGGLGRTSTVYMTTERRSELTPTYTRENGQFEFLPDVGFWEWVSKNQENNT